MIKVNEYITSLKDIKSHIDFALCGTLENTVEVVNDGCNINVLRNIERYIRSFGAKCIILNKKEM